MKTTIKRATRGLTVALAVCLPLILHLNGQGEEVKLPILVDVTEQAGIRFVHSFGDDHLSNIVETTGAGVALFDYDGDGHVDIYLVNGCYLNGISDPSGRESADALQNALYRNNGDGTFTDVTDKAGVGHKGFGMGVCVADYDNDGDADLYVTNFGPNVLYRNNGDGTFTDVTDKAGVGVDSWSTGCTFFDYDGDGNLDLYVGNYLQYDTAYSYYYPGNGFPGPLSYQGRPDVLYRNRGDGTFEDVTKAAGVYNPEGRAMGVVAFDFDDDGDMDIFVSNDAMENYLYRNNGDGTFTNVAQTAGTAFGQNGETGSSMGPEVGDYDSDGLMDVLVPDMGYASLYRNAGQGIFEEMSARTGLAAATGQYTSWSGSFFDFDCEGRLDIFLSNGDSRFLEPEEALLLLNDGNRFLNVSGRIGPDFQKKYVGRGSAVGDLDGDGDLDVVVQNLNSRPRLLRNDGGNLNHWLLIRAVGTRSNRDAIGARIRLTAGGTTQTRDVVSNSGYLSHSDRRVHFGLGSNEKADRIEIRWPSGRRQVLENIRANQVLTITEPGPQ
ncbi:ASPIC/UnbV domain protein [Syntrophobacter fumaroxidans MPOB]|uniref:ASPIC/UnbV domain protein n=1 Tax=Syntrophobacter fumaroxidans (strain DSM 10017 / MPOB) TaxID=335543 RepID=A0LIQ8_SYNFM|nr:ASPIC/UnbV domain protein [Syntrophobacter fumaroxidans MPOB]